MDVHEVGLVKLKNSFQSSHLLLYLFFESVLRYFFVGSLVLDILGLDIAFYFFEFSFKENEFSFSLIWLTGNFDLNFIQKVVAILKMEIVISII